MINLCEWYLELEKFFNGHNLEIVGINVNTSTDWYLDGSKGTVTIEGSITLIALDDESEFLRNMLLDWEALMGDGCPGWSITGGAIYQWDNRPHEYSFDFVQEAA
jgi:hypothetical protein